MRTCARKYGPVRSTAPTNHIGGYTLYNARITWKPDQGNWEASLLALNLTDHFYYLNKFDLTGGRRIR